MKNSTGGNIPRLTTPFRITLLVALAVSSVTGLFRNSLTEAARSVENNTLVRGGSAPDEATRARVTEAFGKLPMSFEANEGQTDGRVKFLSRGNGYTLFLTSSEAVLSLTRGADTRGKSSARESRDRKERTEHARPDVVRMRLEGANPKAEISGQEELSFKSNYFIGNDPKKWRTDVPQYTKVKYSAVYPGVDMVYYGNQRELEYDFIVAPGADPSRIKLRFEGAKELSIDKAGELILRTRGGEIRQRRPVIYQEEANGRREIEGRYVKSGRHAVGFEIGDYDATKPLVIDPVLVYSTYLGGATAFPGANATDVGLGIAVDAAGNAYVTGITQSSDFPTTPGAFDGVTTTYLPDAFVTKLDSTGSTLLYSTYLGGGTNFDEGRDIAVDAAGSAYVRGRTFSHDFPTTPGAFDVTYSGTVDAFVTKLDSSGSILLYSTYLGGRSNEEGFGIAVDAAGNAYVAGETESLDFPTTPGAFDVTYNGSTDAFVTKLDSTGSTLLYSTYLGGGHFDEGRDIAVDAAGNAYVTGITRSSNFPTTPGAFDVTPNGFDEAFVTKLDSTGSTLLYSTYLGGSGSEQGEDIAVDAADNAYVTGRTVSSNFPTTPGAFDVTFNGGVSDVFITKLDSIGSTLLYSTYLGGSGLDQGEGIAVDAGGNAYVTGDTRSLSGDARSANFPTTPGAFDVTFNGGGDAFVATFDSTGRTLLYSTYLGGGGFDVGFDIAVDDAGFAYVTGRTRSANFPTTPGAFDVTFNGGLEDAFVTKLATNRAPTSVDDTATTDEDTVIHVSVLSNDSDPDGDVLTVIATTQGANGSVAINSDGTVAYTPNANFNGTDSFTYTASDGRNGSDTATVTVTVVSVNDAPVAADDSYSVHEDSSLTVPATGVLANDSDVENDALTAIVVNGPSHGALTLNPDGSFSYTPAADFHGADSFSYQAGDGAAQSNAGLVQITINPINDTPAADSGSVTADEDTPVVVTLTASDKDGDALTYEIVTPPAHGALSGTAPDLTYTPRGDYHGPDSFAFNVNDGTVDSNVAHIDITVRPVNDEPRAEDDAATTPEDNAIAINVLTNDSDVDGDGLAVTSVTQGAHGAASVNADGTITYTPNPNFNGADSFTYTVSDGRGGSASATVNVTSTPVNDAPLANDGHATTDEDTSVQIALVAGDIDSPALSFSIVDAPLHGTLGEVAGNRVTYTPDPNYNGADSFTFKANDGQLESNVATVSITVRPMPDPPVLATVGDKTIAEGALLAFNLSTSDPDGDILSFSATGLPEGATLDPVIGAFSWTPTFDQAGSYTVTFKVTDPGGLSASETITITVEEVIINLGPDCSAAHPSIEEIWPPNHTETRIIDILGVTDPDNDPVAIRILRILQDEPTNTLGDGTTWIDGGGIGTPQAWVRAERSGTNRVPGNGRIYEIFFEARDGRGKTCTGSVKVGVPHDQGQGRPAVDDGKRYDSTVAGGPCLNCN